MVATRRKSQTIEPPALPPVAAPKRKRKNDAASASSAAQPPKQPPSKRRKNGNVSANANTPIAPIASMTTGPAARKARSSNKERYSEHSSRKQEENQRAKDTQPKTGSTGPTGSRQFAHVDLTNDDDSSEDELIRRPQLVASQDIDDDEADSRYALGSKRKGRTKKPVAPTARRTAELKFEEDGSEEVDKAEAAVADASKRTSAQANKRSPLPWTSVTNGVAGRSNKDHALQANGKGKDKAKRKIAPSMGVPSKTVMFTVIEAIEALSLYQGGTMSIPVKVDPHSRQPYEPLETGEYLSYPVKGTYHLGSIGRYGVDTLPPLPFSLTVPLSEHSFIHRTQEASAASPARHGLGFDSALSRRPKSISVRRANNYCFTFGKYKGRRMGSVPIEYLRSIHDGDGYYNDTKLQQAFEDLYPKGLYESEAESYTFEKGGFKGKRLDEVPKTYLWGLLRKATEDQLPKKGKGRLERALEVWEKEQLDLTRD